MINRDIQLSAEGKATIEAMPMLAAALPSAKYKIIRCETFSQYLMYKIPPQTFEELKEQIADAFYKGVKWVKLYSDGRKVNSFLEIKAEQFDKSFIEESFKKLHLQNQINERLKRIEILRSDIQWREKRILEIELEIKALKGSS